MKLDVINVDGLKLAPSIPTSSLNCVRTFSISIVVQNNPNKTMALDAITVNIIQLHNSNGLELDAFNRIDDLHCSFTFIYATQKFV